jgi:hypothetical protein
MKSYTKSITLNLPLHIGMVEWILGRVGERRMKTVSENEKDEA